MALKFEKFQSPGKGNGLRATLPVSPGDRLYDAEPFVYTVNKTGWGTVCELCLREPGHLLQCSRCKFAKYCSKRCQTEAWPDHKRECKCLKSAPSEEETHPLRLAGRTILKLLQKKSSPSEDLYSVSELQPNFKDLSNDMKVEFMCLAEMLELYLKEEIPAPSQLPADIHLPEYFAKVTRNRFMIINEAMQHVADGLYPSMSLLNHSCDPNCVVVFKGRNLHLQVTREIQAGEELTITYIEPLLPTGERQNQLKRKYGFECDCLRCRTRDKDEDMVAGDAQASDETKDLVSKVEKLQARGKWEESLALCKAQLEKNIGRLPDKNIYQLKIINGALDASMALSMSKQALQYALRTLGPYRLYYPGYSTVRALRLKKVGMLQFFTGKPREALELLREAFDLMKVAYGRDHSETQQVMSMLECCNIVG